MDKRSRPDLGPEDWTRISELFESLLDSPNPEADLAAVADPELREAASELWRHHRNAQGESFLGQPLEFDAIPAFEPGRILLGRFEIRRLLGAGGMGEVYLAFDRVLREETAIKTIPRLLSSSPDVRERFVAEVQNARRVTHRNVCRIYELFEEGPVTFFSMEKIDGAPLTERSWTAEERRRILYEAAQGLDAAHRNGVIHGDFKPSNVMVEETGRTVVMDFGLARALNRAGDAPASRSARAGTAEYMAPELLAGGEPSLAGDLYAFGKVAAWLLPEERFWRPFLRDDPAQRPPSLEPALRALAPGTNRRYWIAGSIAAAGTAGYAISRWGSAGPKLAGLRRVLLNGFRSAEALRPAAFLTRALMVSGLRQSPRIGTVADEDLLPSLRRFRPAAALPAEGGILDQLLDQHRASHWVEAQLRSSGSRYSLELGVRERAGRTLAAGYSFEDYPSVAALAERASSWLRSEAGESRASLAAAPAGAVSFTSSVPEALSLYYQAMAHYAVGEMDLATPLLEEAIRLDPKFAQAYNILGMCFNVARRFEEAFAVAGKAMKLAAGLPPRERSWIETNYYMLADDPVGMIDAGRRSVAYFPDEPRFRRILAHLLCRAGDARAAVEHNRKAVELSPSSELLWGELIYNLGEAGQFAEALEAYREAKGKGLRFYYIDRAAAMAYEGLGDYEAAIRLLEGAPGSTTRAIQGARLLAGELESAVAELRQALGSARSGNPDPEHLIRESLCGLYFATDRLDLAAEQANAMTGLPALPTFSRQHQGTAFWAARLGLDSVLTSTGYRLSAIDRGWPTLHSRAALDYWRGLRAARDGDTNQAEALLNAAVGGEASPWAMVDLPAITARNGRFEAAERHWGRLDERRGSVLKFCFTGLLVLAWSERAQAAHAAGNRTTARESAKRVMDHWARKNSQISIVRSARQIYASN